MSRICCRIAVGLVLLLTLGLAPAAEKSPAGTPMDARAVVKEIDSLIRKRLDAESIPCSSPADDAEFLRRAYLDTVGVIPPPEKAVAFLDDRDPDKRAKLIDELLASREYAHHMADIWTELLFPRTSDNRRLQSAPLTHWLEEQFEANRPWNELVADLLTASGTQDKNGAVTFFLANPSVDKMTDQTSKLFLGLQLQCAQCHNHPFVKWTRDDYWGMAAFFFKVQPDNAKKAAKNDQVPGVTESGRRGKNRLPDSARHVPAKFLLGSQPNLSSDQPYRPVLTKWVTAPENPYFARAIVNRMWAQFFGRGFVHPVDDMHQGNTPSHAELLQSLSEHFVAGGYDLKQLVRAICNSQAYQRSSKSCKENDGDDHLFSHQSLKSLTPEQLFDSLTRVVGTEQLGRGRKGGGKGGGKGRPDPRSRDGFIAFFREDDNPDPTDYQAGIPQVLRLMNAELTNHGGRLLDHAARSSDPVRVIETLYLGTLSRRPTAEESKRCLDYLGKHEKKGAYVDILWALLNSSEFALCR